MSFEGSFFQKQTNSKEEIGINVGVLAQQIRNHEKVRVYHVDGHILFEGTPREVSDFWSTGNYGRIGELGAIADDQGKTIVRFGASNEHGFVDRNNAGLIIGALGDAIEDATIRIDEKSGETLTQAEKEVELRHCYEVNDAVYRLRRMTLQEDLMLVSLGMNPDTEQTFYDLVSGEVGRNFDAHGIAKMDQLEKLLALLEKGIDKDKPFSSAPFELRDEERSAGSAIGTAGGTCYKDGIAVVTAGYRKELTNNGIKHVFINDLYAGLVAPLKKVFPQYQIYLLSEQKAVLEKDMAEAIQ